MKISVITPVKNLEDFIEETIESVINQRGNFDIEYIIMDGNSSDKTLEICNDYQKQIELKTRKIFCNSIEMKVYSSSDNSMYEALANGLQMVTGDITAYINGDDFYLPNAFSCVAEIFSKFDKIDWITGNISVYNNNGSIVSYKIVYQYNKNMIIKGFHNAKLLPIIQQESSFWRTKYNNFIDYSKFIIFNFAGDYFLWYTFSKFNVNLYIIDTFLSGIRLRNEQLSSNKLNYYSEFNTIKMDKSFMDYILLIYYWSTEFILPPRFKRKFSKHRVRYMQHGWVLQ